MSKFLYLASVFLISSYGLENISSNLYAARGWRVGRWINRP